jgi:hypothetical protein
MPAPAGAVNSEPPYKYIVDLVYLDMAWERGGNVRISIVGSRAKNKLFRRRFPWGSALPLRCGWPDKRLGGDPRSVWPHVAWDRAFVACSARRGRGREAATCTAGGPRMRRACGRARRQTPSPRRQRRSSAARVHEGARFSGHCPTVRQRLGALLRNAPSAPLVQHTDRRSTSEMKTVLPVPNSTTFDKASFSTGTGPPGTRLKSTHAPLPAHAPKFRTVPDLCAPRPLPHPSHVTRTQHPRYDEQTTSKISESCKASPHAYTLEYCTLPGTGQPSGRLHGIGTHVHVSASHLDDPLIFDLISHTLCCALCLSLSIERPHTAIL